MIDDDPRDFDWYQFLSTEWILTGVLIFVVIALCFINAYTDWSPFSNIYAGLIYGK